MSEAISSAAPPDLLASVRSYWEHHVAVWAIDTATAGTPEYFSRIEEYRFSKLTYLNEIIPFEGFEGGKVLDVGCGLANDTSRFARGGAKVTGIDIAPRAIELSKTNFAQRGLPGEFLVMDGQRMDFADNSFDCVYCHTVLHFTPNPVAMVEEICRVLRPGGLAILMTVNRKSWMNYLRHLMKVDIDHLDSPVFNHMTVAEFTALTDCGFSDVDVKLERHPVRTEVHKGLKALVYNSLFVGAFNALPARMTYPTGHHLLAFCRK